METQMSDRPLSAAAENWSPLYFLSALGAGGLAVTFFMYLMFWVPHPGQPVPVFEDIAAYLGTQGLLGDAMVVTALAGIAVFAALHIALLVWNLRKLAAFQRSEAYASLTRSNAESQLKGVPLTLAMSINVGFILGLVFVPGLWSIVEYLFPLAMAAFLAVGVYAFRLLGRFLGRILSEGGFDTHANTSFAQLLPAFALAMVGVGLAAPAAMSQTPWIVGSSLALSTFFVTAALLITVVMVALAVVSMVQHGTAPEAAPTLMILVPIVTVLGIAWMRMSHGLHTTLDVHGSAGESFMFLTRMLALQILFAALGLTVMARQGYAKRFLSRDGTRSAGSYALVCPGVALAVMLFFWVNKGLVEAGLIAKFGVAYWALTAPAIALQVAMIALVWHLHRLHFAAPRADHGAAIPAE
jgi:hypothetical protein